MNLAHYPPQEPLSEIGQAYARTVCAKGQGIAGFEFHYGPDLYQTGLAFVPTVPSGQVLIFLHGGGWTSGYKEWMSFMAPGFTAGGVTFISLGYRLAPQHVFPAGVNDVALGVKWVHDNVADLKCHRDKMFIGGHSAGGHYASLLALTVGWRRPLALPEDVIKGCLPVSGVYDLTAAGGLPTRPRFLGHARTEHAASPIHRAEGPRPPFLIATGERDFKHLISQADQFEARLLALDIPVTRLILAGADHFEASVAAGDPNGIWVSSALQLMRQSTQRAL